MRHTIQKIAGLAGRLAERELGGHRHTPAAGLAEKIALRAVCAELRKLQHAAPGIDRLVTRVESLLDAGAGRGRG